MKFWSWCRWYKDISWTREINMKIWRSSIVSGPFIHVSLLRVPCYLLFGSDCYLISYKSYIYDTTIFFLGHSSFFVLSNLLLIKRLRIRQETNVLALVNLIIDHYLPFPKMSQMTTGYILSSKDNWICSRPWGFYILRTCPQIDATMSDD